MPRKNLHCDQCSKEATVFALQSTLKIPACPNHTASLIEEHLFVFDIHAFNFIENSENCPGLTTKQDIAQKLKDSLALLKERCESNRCEAHRVLQTAKQTSHGVVERSIQELQTQVEQHYQQIQAELNSLSTDLEEFVFDRQTALTPTLEAMSKSSPTGGLFRVCGGDCSLEIVKTVLKSLLSNGRILPVCTGENVLEKAMPKQGELATTNSDFKTAAGKFRRKVTKELLLTLPWTAIEPQIRSIGEQYLQRGTQAREEGNYAKSLKRLERGWDLLRQGGTESAEMCFQLGFVLAHFGRREEACTMLRRGLHHSSSSDLSLKLNRLLVEVYFQTGEWKQAAETGELALASVTSQCTSFELLQLLYFLTYSCYQLGNLNHGYELVTHWTSRVAADSVHSKSTLQCIYAEKQSREGNRVEAARLYEAALQISGVQVTYIAVFSGYTLGWLNAALNRGEKALCGYLQAVALFAAHFPKTWHYAICLNNLAFFYKSRNNAKAAQENYLQAISLYSAQFPLTLDYAICLYNLAILYKSMNNVTSAEELYLKAIRIFSVHFFHQREYAYCLCTFADLLRSSGRPAEAISRMESALKVYIHNKSQDDVTRCCSVLRQLFK